MTDIIEKNYPHTSAEISFNEGGYPPMDRTESNRDLLKKYSQVSQDLDLGVVSAVEPINAGAADISFAADLVDGAIDGLGLSGGKDHTADEYGNIYMLGDTIKRAALLMYRLGN
jgi:glutamate carboxypeptidase